jgi:hypothetical protein
MYRNTIIVMKQIGINLGRKLRPTALHGKVSRILRNDAVWFPNFIRWVPRISAKISSCPPS